ncbi:MAG: VOC family protein [Pseudomonadota bacterium]
MAELKEIVIDALHPAALARFWAETLEDYSLRPYDAEEVARLAGLGLTPETDPSVALDGSGPTIFFQLTETPKAGRNRIHLDLATRDRSAEVARLEKLGAVVRDRHDGHTVMLDPEGNEFCVCDR